MTTTTPRDRTLILTDEGARVYDSALADYDGTIPGDGTPIPQPTFTGAPTIDTDGTPQVGEQVVGHDAPTANLGANVVTRQWRKGAEAVTSSTTLVLAEATTYTFRNQIVAPGGAVLDTATATVTAAPGTPAPAPTLTLVGTLSYPDNATPGRIIGSIGNVPTGSTPTIAPNDGRLVIAGDATNGWKVAVGMTASTQGTRDVTINAVGASSVTATVTVTAPVIVLPPEPGKYKRIGEVGQNLASEPLSYYGTGYPFLDRAKLGGGWFADGVPDGTPESDRVVAVDEDGWPTAMNPHAPRLAQLYGVEHTSGPAGVAQRYVWETTLTDWTFGSNQTIISNDLTPDGKRRRIVFDLNQLFPVGAAFYLYFYITAIGRPRTRQDVNRLFRLDQEAQLNSGQIYTDEWIDHLKPFKGPMRMMDWSGVNGTAGELVNFDEYRHPEYQTWAGRVPYSMQIELCNEVDAPMWAVTGHAVSDQYVIDLTHKIDAELAPHLPWMFELSNEPWNPGFPYNVQYTYFYNLLSVPVPGGSSPTWSGYGYKAARMAALVLTNCADPDRVFPFANTQNWNDACTVGMLAGMRYAIAEWSNPASPKYNADWAERFKRPGQLIKMMGGATYNGAGITTNASQEQLAVMATWPGLPNGGGVTALFSQWEHGDQFPNPEGEYVDAWPATMAKQYQLICVQEQMRLVAYEGGVLVEAAPPGIRELVNQALHDPRMIALMERKTEAVMAAGYDIDCNLCDIGNQNGVYGALENIYDLTAPRYVGLVNAQANIPAPPPVTIALSTPRQTRVGAAPTTSLVILGGRGALTVEVAGLAPGRTFNGFREIEGTFLEEGQWTATIRVTPEVGDPIEVELVQDVGPVATYYSGRWIRVGIYEVAQPTNRIWYPELQGIGIKRPGGTLIVNPFWSKASTSQASFPLSALNDSDQGNYWSGDHLQNYPAGEYIVGYLPDSMSISDIVLRPNRAGSAPGRFKVWLSDNEPSLDAVGGTLVLDVTEPNADNWTQGIWRDFEIVAPDPGAAIPTVTLSGAQAKAEGNSGSTLFNFTVTRSATAGAVDVPWSLAPGSTNAADYSANVIPSGGVVSLAAGAASGVISIAVAGDAIVEADETFTVLIAAPSGYGAGANMSSVGTIQNDDAGTAPGFTLADLPTLRERFTAKSGAVRAGDVFTWTDSVGGKVANPVVNPPNVDPDGWAPGVPAVIMNAFEPLDTNAPSIDTPTDGVTFMLVYLPNNDVRYEMTGGPGGGINLQAGGAQLNLNAQYQAAVGGGGMPDGIRKHVLTLRTRSGVDPHFSIRLDGVERVAFPSRDFAVGNYTIGRNPQGGTAFEGRWAVFARCASYLSDADVAAWEAYEQAEWSVPAA